MVPRLLVIAIIMLGLAKVAGHFFLSMFRCILGSVLGQVSNPIAPRFRCEGKGRFIGQGTFGNPNGWMGRVTLARGSTGLRVFVCLPYDTSVSVGFMFKTLASSEPTPEFTRPREWEIKPTTPRCNEAMKLKKGGFRLNQGIPVCFSQKHTCQYPS